MILVLIGLILITIYVIIMCFKTKSIPPSISETYYLGGGNWFTLTLFVASFLIIAGMLNITEGSLWLFISFFTGAGIALVGASPKFKDNLEGKVHYIGAMVLLLGSLIWLLLFSDYLSIIFLWIPMLYWIFTKQRLFWIEITCLLTVLFGLIFI